MQTSFWRVALGAALLLTGTFATHADDAQKQPPFLGGFLQRSDVVYPEHVDDWDSVREHRYDQAEAGASVRYVRKNDSSGWIDVFFYPVGVFNKEEQAKLADNEREGLIDSWREAMRDHSEITALVPVSVGKPVEKKEDAMPGYALDFAFDHDGVPSSSAMVFAVYNLYAVKFRYTVDEKVSDRAAARETLVQFARKLFASLEIDSTGTCWAPYPIEQLAAGAPDPTGALLTTNLDDKPNSWAMNDRLLTRDASSIDAIVAQQLGRAITERGIEGCSEPSEEQRTAPKGMRVLRMEYTPPGEKTDSGERLRPARSGLG